MPTLAVIIVAWNVRELLLRCLAATEASLAGADIATQIIVVDNASHDATAAAVRQHYPHVTLLEPQRNLGFVGGNNLALRWLGFDRPLHHAPTASAAVTLPDYVLLLNPDTEPQGDALARLVQQLEQHPHLIGAGPRLLYGDGTPQSSRRRFPTRATFFWESTPLERWFPRNRWAQAYHYTSPHDPPAITQHSVDWVVGAALLVRGTAIAAAGLLDERFFMYSEELEWQARLQQLAPPPLPDSGARIAYIPAAVVVHYEGKSSEQAPLTRHLHFQRSRILLAALWYGPSFARQYRRFVQATYLWELLIETGKHLLGHRRNLRRQRMWVYATVLTDLRMLPRETMENTEDTNEQHHSPP